MKHQTRQSIFAGMGDFILVALRCFYGGEFNLSVLSKYVGGERTEFLDVDVDRLSYFELRDYIKELGYNPSITSKVKPLIVISVDILSDRDIFERSPTFQDGDIVKVYVCHMVDEAHVPPFELKYSDRNNQKTCDAFNKGDEDPVSSDHVEEGSDSTNSSSESDHVAVFNGPDVDDGSDIHEEFRTLRVKRRAYKRRSRRKKTPPNPDDVSLGEVEQDIDFDEIEPNDRGLEGRVGGDEPFYYSSETYSCETDGDDGQEGVILAPIRENNNFIYAEGDFCHHKKSTIRSGANSMNTPYVRPRGRPGKVPVVHEIPPRSRGRPRKKTKFVATPTSNAFAGTRRRKSSPAPAVIPRRETEGPSTYPNKRSKTVSMRVFVAESGYTSLNEISVTRQGQE
ncbi:hypothetical protein K7X08_012488 [Anisodus acutangulus]|uniref:PB1-like domain-containing protein n=1 Tax=Anisodus acutangulus TaxID=402998 RepID=A0A9Q1QY96_9SOLA|nr:hypothetical protein K7X08_012488 [Anisodus acutangulus]